MTGRRVFDRWRGVGFALLAVLLFGASTPLAKSLLPQVSPVLMAGLLYLGSGVGLGICRLIRSRTNADGSQEAALTRKDLPWLTGAIIASGIVGPVLLLLGLAATSASSASLLLNLEGVLTALLAWFVFKENFDARIALGMALIASGGVCVSWSGRPEVRLARAPSAEDRRRVFVHLTEWGENVLGKLASAHEEQLKRIGTELGLLLKRLACAE